jgi:hypothetical protein
VEGCSTSLYTIEMQIKTTLRFYLTPIQMSVIMNAIYEVPQSTKKRTGRLSSNTTPKDITEGM